MISPAALLRFTTVAFLSSASPVVAQVVNPANGHTYFSTEIVVTFAIARAQAEAIGGYVVCLENAAEEQWVDATFSAPTWIGLTDEVTEGIWRWESDETFTYQNWGVSTPSSPTIYDYVRSWGLASGWYPVLDEEQPTFGSPAVIETEFPLGPSVEDLTVVADESITAFTWTNPVAFTSIEVYRELELIGTLPGDATSFSTASVMAGRYWFLPRGGTLPARPVSVLAAPTGYRMWVENTQIVVGSPGNVRTLLANEDRIQGYSYGVCHDSAVLELVSVQVGSITEDASGGGLDFHGIDIDSDGFTVSAVLFSAGTNFIFVGTQHEMDIATYQPLAPVGTNTTIDFCSIGSPPSETLVIRYPSGINLTPVTEAGEITLVDGFQRGDGNGDGAVDIADPVHNLEYLFYGGPSFCLDAQDSNDDGAVTIADPVFGLSYQFSAGAPPPPPYGGCGADPTIDSLGCANAPVCP